MQPVFASRHTASVIECRHGTVAREISRNRGDGTYFTDHAQRRIQRRSTPWLKKASNTLLMCMDTQTGRLPRRDHLHNSHFIDAIIRYPLALTVALGSWRIDLEEKRLRQRRLYRYRKTPDCALLVNGTLPPIAATARAG